MTDLRELFRPRSIAIVGASADPSKRGYRTANSLMRDGFSGELFLVNAHGGEAFGRPMYPSLLDVPGPVDLLSIEVPAAALPEITRQAGRKGVRGMTIYTAGFAETGELGAALEAEALAEARKAGIRILGPNTVGFFAAEAQVNITGRDGRIPSGPIGLVSQSGNISMTFTMMANVYRVGLSYFIGVGNQLDITTEECIRFLADDQATRVVVAYIEGVKDGRMLLDALRYASTRKPVVVFKGGATSLGARSTLSHTGSLVVEDRVFDAVCRQARVERVINSDELVEVALTLGQQPIPPGPNVALMGGGGGHATQMADAADRCCLQVPVLSEVTQRRLRENLPDFASTLNPVDFAGGLASVPYPYVFSRSAVAALDDPDIHGLLLFGLYGGWALERYPQEYLDASAQLAELTRRTGKPIVVHTSHARESSPAVHALLDGGVPTFESIEIAARCMQALQSRARFECVGRETSEPSPSAIAAGADRGELIQRALSEGRSLLLETEGQALLGAYGINGLPHRVAENAAAAAVAAEELGYPVAIKVHSTTVVHKTDIGGVVLGIASSAEAQRAFAAVVAAAPPGAAVGAVVYPMAQPGLELILGLTRDPLFGPVVLVGLGGVLAEAIDDVSLRVAPITRRDALEMLTELRGARLLDRWRGRPPIDQEAIADALVQLARLGLDHPEIAEVDLNPVFAYPDGIAVADVRVVLAPSGTQPSAPKESVAR